MGSTLTRLLLACAAAAAVLGAATGSAAAHPAAGVVYENGNVLVTFDTDAPGTVTSSRAISGLEPDEKIQAIDFRDRPAPGAPAAAQALYGLAVKPGATDSVRLYRIDLGTAAATPVGPPIAGLTASTGWDVDFDAATDRLRLVADSDLNISIDPDTGTVASVDGSINPGSATIRAIAYDEEVPGRVTRLFGLVCPEIVLIDENTGNIATSFFTSITVSPNSRLGYDLTPYDPSDPDAQGTYVTLSTPLGTGGLYRFHPAGSMDSLTFLGNIGASIRAFALVPATSGSFAASTFGGREGAEATVTVTRSGPATSTATIAYETTDGTAMAGADYTAASGTLTFAPGETSRTFTVALADDAVDESPETVALTLRAPGAPLALGAVASATLTIEDDDPAPAQPARLELEGLPSRIALGTLLRRGIVVTLAPSQAVTDLRLSLVGRARRAQVSRARGDLVLASRSVQQLSAARSLRLKPPRRLVGRARHGFRLRIEATAIDAGGQPVSVSQRVRVTVPRPRR
jgi:Domain of unknown function (DUF4394)/Calx-beta domain